MISWKAVGLGLTIQLLVQAVMFVGIPLFGPTVLLDWTALLNWGSGPLAGGITCGLVRQGRAWICGLIVGGLGTAVFVSAVMLRSDWWLVGAAIVIGSVLAAGGALVGRAIVGERRQASLSLTAYVIFPVAGFSLLAAFLLLSRDSSFSWIGALAYVLISFGVSYLMAALKIAERFPRLDRYHFIPGSDQEFSGPVSRQEWAARQAAYLESGFRGHRIFLTPAEDGLICVPVLLLGINPVTALLGGALFGFIHLGRFTYLECIGKAIIYALACYFVLPYGLLTIVAGHFVNDLLGLLILKLIRRSLERQRGSGEANAPD